MNQGWILARRFVAQKLKSVDWISSNNAISFGDVQYDAESVTTHYS